MRDSVQFDEFYATTTGKVVAQVYAMVGDLGEAEDAVAEAYSRAWQRWSRIQQYADPSAWVRTVAYRIAVSSWRRARNRAAAHQRSGPAGPVALDPQTVALVDALRRIPPAHRRAIVLHHLVGLSVNEIAAETGGSVSAVKQWLSRGRRALATALGDDDMEEVDSRA
jgi:RNA polymerase sigma-70 factor (ECF subfamily)